MEPPRTKHRRKKSVPRAWNGDRDTYDDFIETKKALAFMDTVTPEDLKVDAHDPEQNEDLAPWESLSRPDKEVMVGVIDSDIPRGMAMRSKSYVSNPKIKKDALLCKDAGHVHLVVECPYADFFEKGSAAGATALLSKRQIEYLQGLDRYKPFQTYIFPKIRNKTRLTLKTYFLDVMAGCNKTPLASISHGNDLLLPCFRLDHDYDIAYACTALQYFVSEDMKKDISDLFEKTRQFDAEAVQKMDNKFAGIEIQITRYFYFFCDCGYGWDNVAPDVKKTTGKME